MDAKPLRAPLRLRAVRQGKLCFSLNDALLRVDRVLAWMGLDGPGVQRELLRDDKR